MSSESPFRLPDIGKEADRLLRNFRHSIQSFPFANDHTTARNPVEGRSFRLVSAPSLPQNFAAFSFPKWWPWGKRRPSRKEIEDALWATTPSQRNEMLKQRTPEQQERINRMMANYLARRTKVRVGKKWKPVEEVMNSLNRRLRKVERSVGVDTFEELSQKPNLEELREILPAATLRGSAPKQQLRKREEDALQLTRVTSGVRDKGMWGGTQFYFGVFAREESLRRYLQHWRDMPFSKGFAKDDFMNNLMQFSSKAELTLMIVPHKKLSIRNLQWEYRHKLAHVLRQMKPVNPAEDYEKDPSEALHSLISLFDPERLSDVSWVDGTRILPHTQFLFSTRGNGDLSIEAINPGPIRDQQTTIIGSTSSQKVKRAIFEMFIGRAAIDAEAEQLFERNVQHVLHNGTLDIPNEEILAEQEREREKPRRMMTRLKAYATKRPPPQELTSPSFSKHNFFREDDSEEDTTSGSASEGDDAAAGSNGPES